MARVAGVDINVHWSFSFVILWVLVQSAFENRAVHHTALILVAVLLVFGCIMLHEMGHAAMALSLNVKVKNILLLPFGGLARIQTVPDKPLYEFLIAAAGPFVNLVIVLLLLPLLLVLGGPAFLDTLISAPVPIIDNIIISFFQQNTLIGLVLLLVVANIILFAFNLIPALPMDGGRILQALLSVVVPYLWAVKIASLVGLTIAIGLLILALQQRNVGLLFISFFILFSARPIFMR